MPSTVFLYPAPFPFCPLYPHVYHVVCCSCVSGLHPPSYLGAKTNADSQSSLLLATTALVFVLDFLIGEVVSHDIEWGWFPMGVTTGAAWTGTSHDESHAGRYLSALTHGLWCCKNWVTTNFPASKEFMLVQLLMTVCAWHFEVCTWQLSC